MALELVGLEAVIEGVASYLSDADRVADSTERIGSSSDDAARRSSGLAGILSGAGKLAFTGIAFAATAAVAGITAAAGATALFGVKAIQMGSDAAEAQAKFETVFATLGDDIAAQLDEFAAAAGRSRFELIEMAAGLGDLFQPLGFAEKEAGELSVQMVELATDLSSFNNMSMDEALRRLSGTLVGSHENALAFGVVINENTLKAQMAADGTDQLTGAAFEQAKVQARLNLLMAGTTAAQGDAIRTSGGWANQMRALQAILADTTTEIGLALLPVVTPLLSRLGELARDVLPVLVAFISSRAIPAIQTIAQVFSDFVSRIIEGGGRLVEIFQLGGFQQLFTVFEDGSNYIGNFMETLGLSEPVAQRVGAAIANLGQWVTGVAIPALQEFGNWFMTVALPAIIPFVQAVWSQLIPGLQQLGVWIGQLASFLLPLLIQWWGFLADHLNIVLPIVGAVIAVIIAINAPILAVIGVLVLLATAWANNWGGIQEKVEAVWVVIGPLIDTAMQNIQTTITMVLTAVQTFWAAHGETILAAATAIWGAIRDYITTSINKIQEIVQFISNAIQVFWAAWGDTILAVAENTWNAILETIDNVILIIQGIVDIFVGAFTGDWELFGEGLRKVWDGVWAEVITILETAWDNISEIIGNLIDEIIGFFEDTNWGAVGRSIIDGIKSGITSAAEGLATAAANAAQAAWDAVMGFIGGHSPSTLFAGAGVSAVEGFIVGIESMTPNAVTAMQTFAGTVTGTFMEELGTAPSTQATSAIMGLLQTGDFSGGILGLMEDDSLITGLLAFNDYIFDLGYNADQIAAGLGPVADLLATGDFIGGIFGLPEDSPFIGILLELSELLRNSNDVSTFPFPTAGMITPLAPCLPVCPTGGEYSYPDQNFTVGPNYISSPMSQALFESKLRQAVGVSS